jgi:hypothetical protein
MKKIILILFLILIIGQIQSFANQATGYAIPLKSACLERDYLKNNFEKLNPYPNLKKALQNTYINECPYSKYILIKDKTINNKRKNKISFTIPKEIFTPQNNINIKIIQSSNLPENTKLNYDLYLGNRKQKLGILKYDEEMGIEIKTGKINIKDILKYQKGNIVITLNSKKHSVVKVAYIIEFSMLNVK